VTVYLLLIATSLVFLGSVMALRAGEHAQFRARLVGFELQYPYGVKPESETAFLVGLTGLVAPGWQRLFKVRGVFFEAASTNNGIVFRILVPEDHAEAVMAALRAHMPGVRVTKLDVLPELAPTLAAQLGLSNGRRMLTTTSAVSVATGLLASMQPLGDGESIVVQWFAQPVGPVKPVTGPVRTTGKKPIWTLFSPPAPTGEALNAERAKNALPLFVATPRIGVSAKTQPAARTILGRVLAAFHAANAPGVNLFRRGVPSSIVIRNMVGRHVPLVIPPCVLNAQELGMLKPAPIGEMALPGLRLGASRLLAPSVDIPSVGRVVAESTFPGSARPLAISVVDSLKHLHVLGPTGVGKSTLLTGLVRQDMEAGSGLIAIDPKGDFGDDAIDQAPGNRVKDFIILDASDEACPVGFNLLAGAAEMSELLVDQVVGTLHNLFKANWGPRTDDILRAALLTLVAEPGMTLCEVPLILTDENFRRRLVGRIDDPVALGPFWSWYESLSEGERTAAIGPVLNKLRQFLLRRSLRNILGQATPRLDLADVVNNGKILIVRLAKGQIGEEAAALLGSLVIARLWQTVMARASQPASERTPFFAYIDEFQDYLHLPTDIADVLAQARGLGMGMTLAHQHLGQLPNSLRDSVLANARSRVIFQTAAADARLLGREVAPYLTPADLQGLGPYEVAVTLAAGNRIAPPASGRTLPPRPSTGFGQAARDHSRAVYGTPRAEVEAAIRARHSGGFDGGSVGRREVEQ
jgi:hypothetical protein